MRLARAFQRRRRGVRTRRSPPKAPTHKRTSRIRVRSRRLAGIGGLSLPVETQVELQRGVAPDLRDLQVGDAGDLAQVLEQLEEVLVITRIAGADDRGEVLDLDLLDPHSS